MGRDKAPKPVEAPPPNTAAPARRKPTILKSGNAGSSRDASTADSSTPLTAAQALFPGWTGKTPLSLLYETCQKRGWEKPIVEPHRLKGGNGFTGHVVVRKKRAKETTTDDVTLRPPNDSPIAVDRPTALEAKHYTACYALFRFANNTRMDMVLPPAIRSYWSLLEKEKVGTPKHLEWLWSTDPFAAAAANAAEQQKRHTAIEAAKEAREGTGGPPKPAEPSKFWKTAPQVAMSQHLRDLVETTVRAEAETLSGAVAGVANGERMVMQDPQLSGYLRSLGFRPSYIDATLRHLASNPSTIAHLGPRDAALEWLRITVPEDDLPPAFIRTKPLDMGIRDATSSSTAQLQLTWAADSLRAEGFPETAVKRALADADGDQGVALDLLLRRLDDDEGATWSQTTLLAGLAQADDVGRALRQQLHEDERLALQSIYGDRFVRVDSETDDILIPSGKDQLRLRWTRHPRSLYPSAATSGDDAPGLPAVIVRSPHLPAYLRLHLTRMLIRRFHDPVTLDLLAAGMGGVISELVDYLSDVTSHELQHPPDPRTVMRCFDAPLTATPSAATSGRSTPNPGAKTSRPRGGGTIDLRKTQKVVMDVYNAMLASSAYASMLKARQALPAWSMRDELLSAIGTERVVLVVGETGSGKTTQVPAFVLESELAKGNLCSIIVTQPRRVSAISIAERVAAEHAQNLGGSRDDGLVGYAIRGERKSSRSCRLLFCTTGVLLRRMVTGDRDLNQVTHVFVDEVHERSVDSDMLLLELKHLLLRNQHIKVVLMSATIQEHTFAKYYNAEVVRIPGRTFPVEDFWLEDIVAHSSYATTRSTGKISEDELKAMRSVFEASGVTSTAALNTLCNSARSDRIDFALIGEAVKIILKRAGADAGAILVFVSGVAEIGLAIDAIRSSTSQPLDILPLHANLPPREQSLVFKPTRHRKVVVATNVAETSITIDDVVYVVNTGRVKETAFDPLTGISRLVEGSTSLASANQRRGRAGRTRPGECWRLYDKSWTEPRMAAQPVPEMLRVPLERIVLQIKSSHADLEPAIFLSQALSPPNPQAVESAWQTLFALGAVEGEGARIRLTALGEHLSMLPVDVRLGKMLVLGVVFRCLDPLLTVTACLSAKPLFTAPPDRRQELTELRMKLADSKSDLLADAAAFEACRQLPKSAMRKHAESHFISISAFLEIVQLRSDLLDTLASLELVPASRSVPAELNTNANDIHLLSALIYASTQRLVRVQLPEARFDEVAGGTVQRDHAAKEVKLFEPPPLGRVFIHPASINFGEAKLKTGFVTYFAKQVTSKPFLRDVTEVPLWGVLLFSSGGLRSEGDGIIVKLHGVSDSWCRMRAWSRIAALASALRRLLDVELRNRIDAPAPLGSTDSPVVRTMLALLARDGR